MGRMLILLVLGLTIVFGVIHLGVMNRIETASGRTIEYHERMQGRNIANSLLQRAVNEVEDDLSWRDGLNESDYLYGDGSVIVDDATTDSSLGMYQLLLTGRGVVGGSTTEVEVLMERTSFAKYSYFTNIEGSIYFITGDTINGPLHTNDEISIAGSPDFYGPVSSTQPWQGTGTPQFHSTTNFNSDSIHLPVNMTDLVNAANSGGLRFNNQVKVQLNDDGTVDVSEYVSGWWYGYWDTPVTYQLSNYNGVISSSQDVYVEGTLAGQLSIHSEDDIIINGDVEYATDPTVDPSSDDMLGLIGEDDVMIDYNAHEANGTQDLRIDASIMAAGGSFYAEHYGSGSPRGRLYVTGGVIQYDRGPVGTFTQGPSGPELNTGFQKSYSYDTRFLNRWPPYFPVQDKYDIISWRE